MQKMEAIGQLTGGVAHDFNNMLQVINGYTDLALLEAEPGNRVQGYLEQVQKAATRAEKLVRQLLLFSRRQVMQPRILNLNEAVFDLLKMLGRLIGEHIQVKWIPSPEPVILFADEGMLDQILLNLGVNSRDAMPHGGVVTIETSIAHLDAEFCATHGWAREGRFAKLQVSDNGIGMDAPTRERIFEPFFTTKEAGKGTGMGLATVYGIIRQHEGMIDCYSEVGVGTAFRVYLPLHEDGAAERIERTQRDVAGGNETILLAEDDADVRAFALTVLRRAGYVVLAAQDGEEAVRLFEQNADRVALLLLDVIMPRSGGKEAHDRIQAIKQVPAVFTSG